jgi:hypothetical protein
VEDDDEKENFPVVKKDQEVDSPKVDSLKVIRAARKDADDIGDFSFDVQNLQQNSEQRKQSGTKEPSLRENSQTNDIAIPNKMFPPCYTHFI